MNMIVDNIVWFYVILAFVAVAFFVVYWRDRRRRVFLYLSGMFLLLLLAAWLMTLFVVTDRQRIWSNVQAMADGFSSNNPDQVVEHLSRDFQHGDITKDNAKAKIAAVIAMFGLADAYVTNPDVEELDLGKGYARIAFFLRVSSRNEKAFKAYLCRSEFVKEDGAWRMKSFKRFPPFANTDQEILYPQP